MSEPVKKEDKKEKKEDKKEDKEQSPNLKSLMALVKNEQISKELGDKATRKQIRVELNSEQRILLAQTVQFPIWDIYHRSWAQSDSWPGFCIQFAKELTAVGVSVAMIIQLIGWLTKWESIKIVTKVATWIVGKDSDGKPTLTEVPDNVLDMSQDM